MNVIALQCRHCGAPLEFSSGVTHVRCRYCDSLMLVRKVSAAPSLDLVERGVLIEEIVSADEQLLKMKLDLREMDGRWQRDRESLLRELNPQAFRIIGNSDWIIVGIVLLSLFVFCALAMRLAGASGLILLLLFGVFPVVILLAHGGLNPIASVKYLRQRALYEQARSRLVDQIRTRFAMRGIDADDVDLLPIDRMAATNATKE